MAFDKRLLFKNEPKYTRLAKATPRTWIRTRDQLIEQLGTARKSEIIGKIGNDGKSYKELISTYLMSF